jgi:DNA-binding PadR family transcriptional regulator
MYNYNYSINIDNNKNQKSITHTPFGVTDIESNLDAQAPSSPGAATYDYASWVTQDSEMEEIVAAVTRTTHHGGIGGASIRQLKAFLKLGGIERDSVHTKVLAKELGVAWGSIYPTLNKLKDSGIVEMVLLPGQYRLSQDFLDNLFDFRVDKGEFHKDEEIREGIEEDRKVARYETELYVALREGGNVEDAEVPAGVPHKKIVKAQAKAMASLERPRRKLEEMASRYNKDSRVDEFMMWLASNRLQYGQRGYSG